MAVPACDPRLRLLALLLARVKLAAFSVLLRGQCLSPFVLAGLDILQACSQSSHTTSPSL